MRIDKRETRIQEILNSEEEIRKHRRKTVITITKLFILTLNINEIIKTYCFRKIKKTYYQEVFQ